MNIPDFNLSNPDTTFNTSGIDLELPKVDFEPFTLPDMPPIGAPDLDTPDIKIPIEAPPVVEEVKKPEVKEETAPPKEAEQAPVKEKPAETSEPAKAEEPTEQDEPKKKTTRTRSKRTKKTTTEAASTESGEEIEDTTPEVVEEAEFNGLNEIVDDLNILYEDEALKTIKQELDAKIQDVQIRHDMDKAVIKLAAEQIDEIFSIIASVQYRFESIIDYFDDKETGLINRIKSNSKGNNESERKRNAFKSMVNYEFNGKKYNVIEARNAAKYAVRYFTKMYELVENKRRLLNAISDDLKKF